MQTIETMLVQMFVEAKRHQPSVLYIPALSQWSAVLTPTAKATFGTLLDSLTPSEPVIVIAFMEEPLLKLDDDIKTWFGRMGDNLIELHTPDIVSCRDKSLSSCQAVAYCDILDDRNKPRLISETSSRRSGCHLISSPTHYRNVGGSWRNCLKRHRYLLLLQAQRHWPSKRQRIKP